MTARDRYEQTLPARLADLAVPQVPPYLEDVIRTTARTRQRPGWSFPERWLPMSAITDRLATTPRAPLRLVAAAALIILAIAALLVVAAGGRQPSVPAPFGPAANGRIAWVDESGAIVVATPDSPDPTTVIAGPGNANPQFSPDGTRLLVQRASGGVTGLIVAAADGSGQGTIVTSGTVTGAIWAPDSRSIVIAEPGALSRIEARAGATPTIIARRVDDAFDWNMDPAMLFRPPAGEEIAYITGNAGDKRIVVANADGSAPREILAPGGPTTYTDLWGLRWSPDGSQLLVTATRTVDPDSRVYVLEADGSGIRQVTDLEIPGVIVSESHPQWSPDGRSLVMQRWLNEPDNPGVGPLIVVDVADGTMREVGNVSNDGFTSFAWSPDGRSIYSVDDAGTLEVIDVATGQVASEIGRSASGATWQRTVP